MKTAFELARENTRTILDNMEQDRLKLLTVLEHLDNVFLEPPLMRVKYLTGEWCIHFFQSNALSFTEAMPNLEKIEAAGYPIEVSFDMVSPPRRIFVAKTPKGIALWYECALGPGAKCRKVPTQMEQQYKLVCD